MGSHHKYDTWRTRASAWISAHTGKPEQQHAMLLNGRKIVYTHHLAGRTASVCVDGALPLLLAPIHHLLKELAKDMDPLAHTDARQAGIVGERLVQVVA